MKIYRIYTERKRVTGIKEIVRRGFRGFTVIEGIGSWDGREERSLVIEILGDAEDAATVRAVAREIRHYNDQEAVLVTEQAVVSSLI